MVTLIEGDGIGPEVIQACVLVLDKTGVPLEYERVNAGQKAIEAYGTPLPEDVLLSIKRNRVALKGPVTTPVASGFRSVNVALRQKLDLYANVRPAKSIGAPGTRDEDVDIVVIRENTEGLYSGVERMANPDRAESIRIITRSASERIARFAFDFAMRNRRKKVTSVHKANILKLTDGLFLDCSRKVASEYPDLEYEERIVDNMAMQLVVKPNLYDVLLTTNLFGDILSDLCAGLVGGLGLAASANMGEDLAVFEPVHGSAPKYAGKNRVNPAATILSGAMMLDYMGYTEEAGRVRQAVEEVVRAGKTVTYDLGGSSSTLEMARAIADRL